jgi:uncharacterized membrane protein
MDIGSWIFGPQIVGSVFFILGLVQFIFPPKHINRWYGFRTPSAKKNQQTWDAANRYSAIYLIKSGLILLIAGLLITWALQHVFIPFNLKEALLVFLFLVAGMLPSVLMIVATEKYLRNTFDRKP